MLLIYILLGIIAVGILLLSEPGKHIVNSTFSALWILLITSGFVYLSIWLWSIIYQNKEQIGSGIESTAPTILIIGLLFWLGKKIESNNSMEDDKLSQFGRFIKHTGKGMMTIYVIAILIVAALITSLVS